MSDVPTMHPTLKPTLIPTPHPTLQPSLGEIRQEQDEREDFTTQTASPTQQPTDPTGQSVVIYSLDQDLLSTTEEIVAIVAALGGVFLFLLRCYYKYNTNGNGIQDFFYVLDSGPPVLPSAPELPSAVYIAPATTATSNNRIIYPV
jgi:hypothetical protein